jgi:hypothetical protein
MWFNMQRLHRPGYVVPVGDRPALRADDRHGLRQLVRVVLADNQLSRVEVLHYGGADATLRPA